MGEGRWTKATSGLIGLVALRAAKSMIRRVRAAFVSAVGANDEAVRLHRVQAHHPLFARLVWRRAAFIIASLAAFVAGALARLAHDFTSVSASATARGLNTVTGCDSGVS